jgi:hypothetical protein
MRPQKVISREYKVMLRANRFGGDERALAKAAGAFWHDFTRAVSDIVRRTDGTLAAVESRRVIRFFDTKQNGLNETGYIFRERRDAKKAEREVTLKFRHHDRHFAQARDMVPQRGKGSRTKFEEDIKPPFVSLYSFSTTVPVGKKWKAATLRDVLKLFPDLRENLHDVRENEALAPVGNFTARELVFGGGTVRFGKRPTVDAECALIVWYDDARRDHQPVAVEFSYRYGDKKEKYEGTSAHRAYQVFSRIQDKLGRWIDPNPRTKTAFVYR